MRRHSICNIFVLMCVLAVPGVVLAYFGLGVAESGLDRGLLPGSCRYENTMLVVKSTDKSARIINGSVVWKGEKILHTWAIRGDKKLMDSVAPLSIKRETSETLNPWKWQIPVESRAGDIPVIEQISNFFNRMYLIGFIGTKRINAEVPQVGG